MAEQREWPSDLTLMSDLKLKRTRDSAGWGRYCVHIPSSHTEGFTQSLFNWFYGTRSWSSHSVFIFYHPWIQLWLYSANYIISRTLSWSSEYCYVGLVQLCTKLPSNATAMLKRTKEPQIVSNFSLKYNDTMPSNMVLINLTKWAVLQRLLPLTSEHLWKNHSSFISCLLSSSSGPVPGEATDH